MAIKDNNLSYFFSQGTAPILLVGDHAGRDTLPDAGDLGILVEDWDRHIAYDIGVSELGRLLNQKTHAPFIEQRFSRLLLDCNRNVSRTDRIPLESDETKIPGNLSLNKDEILRRDAVIFKPYQDFIESHLETMTKQDEVLFVSLHSFTPALRDGIKRKWDMGFLFEHDVESAQFAKSYMNDHYPELTVGMNEPYQLTSDKEFTTPYHAGRRNLRALEIEIRQDLLSTDQKRNEWSVRLAGLFGALREHFSMDK